VAIQISSSSAVTGRTIESVSRRGKFLLIDFSGSPMLTRAIQVCIPSEKVLKCTCVIMELDNQQELRHLDDKQMGPVYHVSSDRVGYVPLLWEQLPNVLKHGIIFRRLKAHLPHYHGEIKGILNRSAVISGI
jgi:formamidopyrimidine-DNA glycosylase